MFLIGTLGAEFTGSCVYENSVLSSSFFGKIATALKSKVYFTYFNETNKYWQLNLKR